MKKFLLFPLLVFMTAVIVPACSDDEEDIFPPETSDTISNGGSIGGDSINDDIIGGDSINDDIIGGDSINDDIIGGDSINDDIIGGDSINDDIIGGDSINDDIIGGDSINDDIIGGDSINDDIIGGDSINSDPVPPIPAITKRKFKGVLEVNGTYVQDSIVCQVFSEGNKLTLDIFNVKFAANMPMSINLTVPEIPCEGHSSNASFVGDSIVPMMGIIPASSFMFESISGSVAKHRLNFKATISGRGTFTFSGQEVN